MKKASWMQQLLQMRYSFDNIESTSEFPLGRPTDKNTGIFRVFVWNDEFGHENFPFTAENPFYAPNHAKNPWVDVHIYDNSIEYVREDRNLFKKIEQLWEEIVTG